MEQHFSDTPRVEGLRRADIDHLIHPNQHSARQAEEGSIVIERGSGTRVWDVEGREFIDATASLWLSNVGHGRTELADAAADQMRRLEFYQTFRQFGNEPAIKLAARLAELTPGDLRHVCFTLGGSEANEMALKIVRFYFASVGQPDRKVVIGLNRAYHGTSYGALSAGGIEHLRTGFGSLLPDFHHIDPSYRYRCALCHKESACHLGCADLLERAICEIGPDRVAAFIAEPIQGVGGTIEPADGYFQRIREICDRYGVLWIADEVITGFGRTGRWFGTEHWGVAPDVMTVAKGITSGYLPLGAAIISDRIHEGIRSNPSMMYGGYTYSGHPVACAVALKNLEIVQGEGLVEAASRQGAYLRAALEHLRRLPWLGDIRGKGLMVAIELVTDRETRDSFGGAFGAKVETLALKQGLICRAIGDTIALSPPLTVDTPTLDEILQRLERAIVEAGAVVASA